MSETGTADTAKLRVLIVDDDPIVRSSLATILEADNDIVICGEGSDGLEAVQLYATLKPDILLSDIQMPNCSGIDAARKILGSYGFARIVLLTTFLDDEYIVAALRMGAKGYLIKQDVAQIAPALKAVMAGQIVLGGEIMDRVAYMNMQLAAADAASVGAATSVSAGAATSSGVAGAGVPQQTLAMRTSSARAQSAVSPLSQREQQIIALIAQGLDNKEIAASIYISEGTVRNHVSAILQKLELKNRTQLAIYYYQH